MESSAWINNLIEHPGGSTSAGYQFDVASVGCPVVPEMLQGTDEVGGIRVEPGKLIEEDDFVSFLKAVVRDHLALDDIAADPNTEIVEKVESDAA